MHPAPATRPLDRTPLRLLTPPRPHSSPAAVVLRACRPRQWLKNLLVGLAPAAAGALVRPAVLAEVAGAFVAFCLLSSATYLVNDVRDREQDRLHPRKRHRPVACGELRPRGALRLAALLAANGLALAFAVRPPLAAVGLGYVALTTGYSIWWRSVVVVDVLVVAGGFVLRAVGGAAATGVPLSRSFLIVAWACALLLITGKRYAELLAADQRTSSRATLRRYSRRSLRLLLSATVAVGIGAYGWWVLAQPGPGPWRALSLLPFSLWLGRYLRLLGTGRGEAPEEAVIGDPTLLGLSFIWLILFTVATYGTA
jgi:decaprenyl-phosphate phosphoribosyltransferase